ncbi:Fungal-trans domain-containing protein [Fusarium sp. LHS14.1]|nr:Fungal-trans domain-containing protein [Fusarium sp. LHS14.1]
MSDDPFPEGDLPASHTLLGLQTSHDRRKRAQVVRACDYCRRQRIKCDNRIPCTPCQARGSQCSNAVIKSTTLPQAYREIERSRRKIHELESELQQQKAENNVDLAVSASQEENIDPLPSRPSHRPTRYSYGSPTWLQKGVHICAGQSTSKTWYGPSSLFYFVTRVLDLLGPPGQQSASQDQLPGSVSASSLLDEPRNTVSPMDAGRRPDQAGLTSAPAEEYMSLMQEEFFIELYWQSHHAAVFPIIDEAEFREHYRSLWTAEGNVRKPSPLVDIVIAVSMQLGISATPAVRRNFAKQEGDATVVGRRYYLRCQKLLAYELENPVTSTLQSQILCSVYLCCANFQNMSDSTYSPAIRTAYMMGLHLDPPDSLPSKEREMRRRLWWAIYILDSKIGMKYGRPFLLNQTRFLPQLPEHSLDAAMEAGSRFSPLGSNLSWLSFHRLQTELFMAVRTVYTSFFDDSSGAFTGNSASDNIEAFEAHAEAFHENLKEVDVWAQSVPDALRTSRLNNGRPLSTDSCQLEIELYAPLWLQRQRLLLELMYHNLCVNLCRPFIFACSASPSSSVEQLGVRCAQHAATLTKIMHQILSSTDILNGWHEAFQWQWNAAMTLVGFVLAYPQAASTAEARKGIDVSLDVLDVHSASFAVAAKAADVVRRLRDEVDRVASRQNSGLTGQTRAVEMAQGAPDDVSLTAYVGVPGGTTEGLSLGENGFDIGDMSSTSLQAILNMAFDVDQWAEPYMLWPNGDGPGA